MTNLSVFARGLLVVVGLTASGCTTQPFNTRAITQRDGGVDGAGRPQVMPDAAPEDNTPKCPTEAPTSPKAVGDSCKCPIECATGSCEARVCCSGGACAALRPLGAECENASDCQSGFCADGVCCNVACSGACVSCNQADQMGECAAIPAGGEDVHDICRRDSPETCGQSGYCNGQGGCAKYPAGTTCKRASCEGTDNFVPAGLCDGEGTCEQGVAISCYPSTCDAGACRNSCTINGDCKMPNTCVMGSCGPKGLGQDCTANDQCASKACVDGVCCENACTGKCFFCASPEARGKCVAVKPNTIDQRAARGEKDPTKVCVDQGPSSCGTDGRCDGKGACQKYKDNTVCKDARCDAAANNQTPAGVCKAGACVTPPAQTCAPYKGCMGNACRGTCGSDAQCVTPNVCTAGDCGKKPNGALCSRAVECVSNICSQGRCCDAVCNGTCKSCAVAGALGTCANVPAGGADPAGVCKNDDCNNLCDGNGGCRREPVNTPCGPLPSCNGAVRTFGQCSAGGACESKTQTCGGATPMCTPDRCAPPDKLPPGGACFQDAECQAGLKCIDANCCSGCTDKCKTCNAGSNWVCTVDRTCPLGQRCISSSGMCQGCTGGQTLCGDQCKNLNNDPANCGGCGVACGGANNTCCGGRCVNLQDDEANCGRCNTACSGICTGATCKSEPGDVCGNNGECASGQCKGHCCAPGVTCAGACRLCLANTGLCGNAGTMVTCNDGRACTNADRCDGNGNCTGTVTCNAPPPCFSAPGTCGGTGACVYGNQSPPNSGCGNDQNCCNGMCCGAGLVCRNGGCNPPLPTCNPAACQAMGQCKECKPDGTCGNKAGSPGCNDGKACTTDDKCGANGVCAGVVSCTSPPNGQCFNATGACNDAGACAYTKKTVGTACNDGNACTSGDKCNADGVCQGDGVSCTTPPNNQCFTSPGSCSNGSCTYPKKAVGTACDDGNSCTTGDKCNAEGVCQGAGTTCTTPPNNQCFNSPGSCSNGSCSYTKKAVGTACNDGNSCTSGDACNADGVCQGDGVSCTTPPNNQCFNSPGSCSNGSCSYTKKAVGTGCNDGNSCTTGDACNADGVCQGDGVSCTTPPNNQCFNSPGSCSNGSCSYTKKAVGTGCNDGNSCTTGDACNADGVCEGDGVSCTMPPNNQCFNSPGSCSNGSCSYTKKAVGTGCNDGNSCTTGDACNADGVCEGDGVSCTMPPNNQCFESPGMCSGGGCVYMRKQTGSGCSDGNSCTTGDQCNGDGQCEGEQVTCNSPPNGQCFNPTGTCTDGDCRYTPRETGTTCNDQDACTTNDECKGNGECRGDAVTCNSPPNTDCFNSAGSCNGGNCNYTKKPDGTACGPMRECRDGDCVDTGGGGGGPDAGP